MKSKTFIPQERFDAIAQLPYVVKIYGVYNTVGTSKIVCFKHIDGRECSRGYLKLLKEAGITFTHDLVCDRCKIPFTAAMNSKRCPPCADIVKKARKIDVDRRALLAAYGLTPEEYEQMLVDQGGRCKICREEPKRFVVDHDHVTGEVRGLLCVRCNSCLGWFESFYAEAVQYLGSVTQLVE